MSVAVCSRCGEAAEPTSTGWWVHENWHTGPCGLRMFDDPKLIVEHTVLVAFVVSAGSRAEAQAVVMACVERGQDYEPDEGEVERNELVDATIEGWWVAEDDRTDGSDNWSAVLVPEGMSQDDAMTVLDNWHAHNVEVQS